MVDKLFSEIKSVPECLQASHFPGLDGLRGIAILCVIFSHALLDHGMNYFCYALGMIGVQTFFVISGFLITTLLLKEKVSKGKVSLKNFYIRRFLRLAPVAYLFLFVVAVLTYIFKLDLSLASYLSAALYVKNLPFAHGHDRLVGHFWTLAIEEQFYIIFPILLIYRPNKYLVIILLLMLFIPILQYLGFNKIGVFYSNSLIHILTFIIIALFGSGTFAILSGSLLSLLMFKGILDLKKINSNYWLSFVIFIIAAAIRYATVYPIYFVDIGIVLFSFGIAYVILLSLKSSSFFNLILNNSLMIKIGVLSYSLYVWQALFTHYFIWEGWFKFSDSLWLNLPILFLVAYISYNFYERTFLKLKAKFH